MDSGALAVKNGKKTGRSPLDRRLVFEEPSANDVRWGKVNAEAHLRREHAETHLRLERLRRLGRGLPRASARHHFACLPRPLRGIASLPWTT